MSAGFEARYPKKRVESGRTNGKPTTISAANLMTLDLPPTRWAVSDLIPEGVYLLAGKPKMGKSWMALALGLAVAGGDLVLGSKQVEQGEALYLALEDNQKRLHKRIGKLLAGKPAPEELHLATEWGRSNEGGVEALDAWLGAHPDARLVIVDTLARFKPASVGRRSQYDEDRDAADPLILLAAEHGVSFLVVHHLREMESEDPLDMIHGSAGLTGGVDGALVLKRRRGRADAYLHVDGRDIETPAELALEFDAKKATWTIVGDAEDYRRGSRRTAILEILGESDEPLGPKDITEMLVGRGEEATTGSVREMLSQMVKDGQVKNIRRGQYVHPHNLNLNTDDADNLTNGTANVSPSGMSAHPCAGVEPGS